MTEIHIGKVERIDDMLAVLVTVDGRETSFVKVWSPPRPVDPKYPETKETDEQCRDRNVTEFQEDIQREVG